MANPERRAFRASESRENPEWAKKEEEWRAFQALYDEVLRRTPDRIKTRERINDFREELQHLYTGDELRRYRAYNHLSNSAEAGVHVDFPDNRIENFLRKLLAEIEAQEQAA